MSRLALTPLVFAGFVALLRLADGVIPLLLLQGVLKVRGAGGRELEPTETMGTMAWAWAGLGAGWNLLVALSLLVAVSKLVAHRRGARGLCWAWVALSAGEVAARGLAVAVSPWAGGGLERLVLGPTAVDDACCCLPASALWTLGFAGWLVATRDPLGFAVASTLQGAPPPAAAGAWGVAGADALDRLPDEPPGEEAEELVLHPEVPVPPPDPVEPRPDYALLDEAAAWFDRTASSVASRPS